MTTGLFLYLFTGILGLAFGGLFADHLMSRGRE